MLNEAIATISEIGPTKPLNTLAQDEIERIGTEALINAFRHANANRIDIEIKFSEEWFTLTIRDDGLGIDDKLLSQGRSGHWGLKGMHERSSKLGGSLKISSRIGNGTEVQLAVPADVAYAKGHSPRAHMGWARRLIPYY
jgi:signal transduction histidine kinase